MWRKRGAWGHTPVLRMALRSPPLLLLACAGLLSGCPRGEEAKAPPRAPEVVPARPVQRPSGMPLREYLAQEADPWMNGVFTRLAEKHEKGGAAALTKDELTFLRAEQLGLHLNRGGLQDLYASPWADDPAALREALSDVKAPPEMARILDESRKAFGAEVPASAEERAAVLAAYGKKGVDPFNGLDAPLRELLFSYADAVATWARARAEVLAPAAAPAAK